MRYDDNVIEQVRTANDIVDVIGQYVRLTKKGANYFGLCPFHGEKTASFSVSPRKQIYYCFGCGAGGNVIHFIMEYENMSFTEAVKHLADRVHIVLPEPNIKGENPAKKELKQKLLDINKAAAFFYNDLLKQAEGENGLNYFKNKRKMHPRTITHFGLGYSPKSSDKLYTYIKSLGYDDETLSKSGLFTFEEKGVHDKFWNRVMFPIMDVNSKVVGFGGRVLGDGLPKYLNSPETLIFDKSSILYGLNFAKKSRAKNILLCEGYMDVIALHQAGFENSVACLGTALTEKHARLLKRYTDEVILTQDSDLAGTKAKIRAFPILHDAHINVKVLKIEGAKDPDEFIKKFGSEAFEKLIRDSENAFFFVTDTLKDSFDLSDPAAKTSFMKSLASELCIFEDKTERDNYTEAIALRYMIDIADLKLLTEQASVMKIPGSSNISPAFVNDIKDVKEYDAHAENNTDRKVLTKSELSKNESLFKAEKLLLSWTVERPNLWIYLKDYISPSDFDNSVMKKLAESVFDSVCSQSGFLSEFDAASFLDSFSDEEEERALACELISGDMLGIKLDEMSKNDIEKGLTEFVKTIKNNTYDKSISESGNDLKLFSELLKKKDELKKLYVKIEEN